MSTKKPSLMDALGEAAHGKGSAKLASRAAAETVAAEPPTAPAGPGAQKGAKAYRAGRVNITGYFDPAVKVSIRMIQTKHPERTTQDLLAEALNDLFAKYNVPQSAHLQK